jgi:hypothetical protein
VTTRVEHLTIEGDPATWRSIGFEVDRAGRIPLYGTSLEIVPPTRPEHPAGIVAWGVSGIDSTIDEIDALPTAVVGNTAPRYADHPVGAVALDHVVVLTSSIERTSRALERATGSDLRRIREVGTMRQGFHRLGGLIVELVERPEVTADVATFWGLVVVVDDLDAACALLGDRIGGAKEAVQPGRRIATLRAEAGVGVPLALMTP